MYRLKEKREDIDEKFEEKAPPPSSTVGVDVQEASFMLL